MIISVQFGKDYELVFCYSTSVQMLFDRPHIYVTSETKCIEHCQRKQTFFAYTELKSNVSLNESEFFNGYKQKVHNCLNIEFL